MSAIAQAQAAALIARVKEDAARRIVALREATDAECERIRRGARRDARVRIHAAIAEKRRRIADRCHAIDIENEAARRAAAFRAALQVADEALSRLPAALAARWRDDEARRAWCRAAAACAARILCTHEWAVQMPAASSGADRDFVEALATEHGALIREWADCASAAGLRIGHDDTWVDATAERLLADRSSLAARALAELDTTGDRR